MTRERDDDIPLHEFEWSDAVVGMGYLPWEVCLPPGWRSVSAGEHRRGGAPAGDPCGSSPAGPPDR